MKKWKCKVVSSEEEASENGGAEKCKGEEEVTCSELPEDIPERTEDEFEP